MPDPASVLQAIATVVAVAEFLVSERLEVTIENIRGYFSRQGLPAPEHVTGPEGANLVSLLVIDPDLLDTLDRQTRDAISAYNDCLKKAKTRGERSACDRRVEQDVCETLDRIRYRNDGELPTDYLRSQWSSYGCSSS